MSVGVLLLNFGEPPEPEYDRVVDYLERIFFANAELDGDASEAEARERSRTLAERRAPALLEEYEEIGGSPLNEQATAQAERLQQTLSDRGFDVSTYVGMQFTEPFVDDAVARAHDDGVEELVCLPIYPLCGPSTTVVALETVEAAIDDLDWDVPVDELTGWHRHPAYNRLRAENVAAFVDERGISLADPDTALVFSAHGTPRQYLEAGSRYDRYVTEYCDVQASLLGVEDYHVGYQNHENRDIPWTEPDVEDLVVDLDAERAVVEPVSFLHEQSETLSELDVELREEATEAGIDLYRVPIPHDDDRIPALFADLVEPFLADFEPEYYQLRQCRCRDDPKAVCLNGPSS